MSRYHGFRTGYRNIYFYFCIRSLLVLARISMKTTPVIDRFFSRDIVWWHLGAVVFLLVILDILLSGTFFTPLQLFKWMLFAAVVWALLSLTRRDTAEPEQTPEPVPDPNISTMRRDEEEKLRRNEQYFRALADCTADATLVVGGDGTILYGSPAAEPVLGRTTAELIGKSILQFVHPDEKAATQEYLAALRQGAAPASGFEICMLLKDGSVRRLEGRAGKTATPLTGVVVTLRDTTQRHLREKEVQLFRTAAEQAENAVMLAEVSNGTPGNVLYRNPAWERLAGSTEQTPDTLFGDNGEALRESLRDGKTRSGETTLHTGETGVPVAWTITPLRGEDNSITHVAYTLRDIAEQKLSAAQLQHAKEQAEQHDRFKGALLDTMNRTFRTPMNGILGLSDILEKSIPDSGYGRLATMLRANAEQAATAVNSALLLAGVIADLPSGTATVDVKTEVEALLDRYRVSARDKGIKLYFDTITDEVIAAADPQLLREITAHLLGNAFRFTHKGSITVQVFTGEYNDALHAAVRVIDTGSGMPKEQLTRLFDGATQEQVQKERLYKGSGLGLAFVRRVLDVLGGGVTVESEPGKGSIFTVYLPLADAATDTAPDTLPEQTSVLFVGTTFSDTGVLLAHYLDGTAALDEAEGGASAVELAAQRHYHVVLVETVAGNIIDPADILAAVRSINGYADVPAVAITDCTTDADTAYLRNAGFTECLVKPFDRRQLLGVIVRSMAVREVEG